MTTRILSMLATSVAISFVIYWYRRVYLFKRQNDPFYMDAYHGQLFRELNLSLHVLSFFTRVKAGISSFAPLTATSSCEATIG